MTKVTKWWHKLKFWTKVRMFIGALGIGGEGYAHAVDLGTNWKVICLICTLLALFITLFFTDDDGNGLVDILENKPTI